MGNSTIAAIATPVGKGGIGIIKISGNAAIPIATSIFRKFGSDFKEEETGLLSFESHRLYHGRIINPKSGNVLDEVLLSVMKAPRSYTREDVVEINSHSGMVVLSAVLELVLNMGARLAEPGEFTKRAFLHGRIDLTQAEGIIDIINARTEKSLRIAGAQLNGALAKPVRSIRHALLEMLAEMEATIDFPDDMEELSSTCASIQSLQRTVIQPLQSLLNRYQSGHVYRDGIKMAVVGRPNVGKSSLVNRMIQKDRIIVTAIPGTTRDLIEETLDIRGIPVIITDTAGLHRTTDLVESIGIQKTQAYIRSSDLVLFMVDASRPLSDEDNDIYKAIEKQKTILVINKSDLVENRYNYPIPCAWEMPRIMTSALCNHGIDALKDLIAKDFVENGVMGNGDGIVPNLRHKQSLEKCIQAAHSAFDGFRDNRPEELIVMDMKEAVGFLDEILGLSASGAIIEEIFQRFCIGK